jgi:hypothetical protein
MAWVQYNAAGAICGVCANKQNGIFSEEFLSDDDAAVVAYLKPPNTVPASISDRQFFQQLAVAGIITQDQALASNAAIIPPPLMTLIDAMPTEQQFSAKMIVSGATTFNRADPLTIAIGAGYGMTSDQIDAFFMAAAQL